jgi:anaerobilin synthase
MFLLQILRDQPRIKFDQQLPMFNWHYPFSLKGNWISDRMAPFRTLREIPVRRRAIYIHIPFCETICTFCPFRHDRYRPDDRIGAYVRALIREIELKREFLGKLSVDAVFIGGGTPSLLSPQQIEMLGAAIADNFDLRALQEFTFEIEVKSLSQEKAEMMREIGVNRVSFGAQTFSKRYRELFALDASLQQIEAAAEMLKNRFRYTNVD